MAGKRGREGERETWKCCNFTRENGPTATPSGESGRNWNSDGISANFSQWLVTLPSIGSSTNSRRLSYRVLLRFRVKLLNTAFCGHITLRFISFGFVCNCRPRFRRLLTGQNGDISKNIVLNLLARGLLFCTGKFRKTSSDRQGLPSYHGEPESSRRRRRRRRRRSWRCLSSLPRECVCERERALWILLYLFSSKLSVERAVSLGSDAGKGYGK